MVLDSHLVRRAGHAGHDLVGWLMWDQPAISRFADLGVPNGAGWLIAWRLAPLGAVSPAAAAAATYSIAPHVIEAVMGFYRAVTDEDAITAVRDDSIVSGLAEVAPGLGDQIAELADDLWRGADAVHAGARPMFAATRAAPRPQDPVVSAWLAANCLRELRGDNHWALCAAEDLDGVEVGLLHAVMVDEHEYDGQEWIARSRGHDDDAIAAGWARLAAKGLADDHRLNDAGRDFRLELERRTDAATATAWAAVGGDTTRAFCDAVEPYHDMLLARIDATAGPRWMPAMRSNDR
ncbi:MAG: SCO6745 family protein [Ilumatobacteraceae bacterium]